MPMTVAQLAKVHHCRLRVATVAAVLLTLPLGACSNMDTEDQAVIDRIAKLDIVALPADATPVGQSSTKGGGADLLGIRNASTYTVVYFLPKAPLQVREDFRARFPTWQIVDDGSPLADRWQGSGRLTGTGDTVVEITARRPAPSDVDLVPGRSIVTVQASAVRPG